MFSKSIRRFLKNFPLVTPVSENCQSFKELKLVLQGKKTQREKEWKNAF